MHNAFTSKKYKVAAYITAYEDIEAVTSCVQAINTQSFPIQKIFIVDNSCEDSTVVDVENVVIRYCPENIGVAGGIKLAVEWALEKEYDFLWAFDQDSIPTANCLEALLREYRHISQHNYKISIIAPTAIDLRTDRVVEGAIFDRDRFTACKYTSQSQPYECDAPITSGSLISIAAAKTIPLPCADLFIDGVDLDYGLQLKQKGFYNLIVPQAILYHKFSEPVKVTFLQQERFLYKYSALRHYYICRNHTYLDTRYAKGWYRLTSCLKRMKYLASTSILIFLYDPEDKALKIWACIIGTCHGFKGKLGKTWQ